MLSQTEINAIRNLLLSERITYKGNEVGALSQVLAALQREENGLRIKSKPQLAAVQAGASKDPIGDGAVEGPVEGPAEE